MFGAQRENILVRNIFPVFTPYMLRQKSLSYASMLEH